MPIILKNLIAHFRKDFGHFQRFFGHFWKLTPLCILSKVQLSKNFSNHNLHADLTCSYSINLFSSIHQWITPADNLSYPAPHRSVTVKFGLFQWWPIQQICTSLTFMFNSDFWGRNSRNLLYFFNFPFLGVWRLNIIF